MTAVRRYTIEQIMAGVDLETPAAAETPTPEYVPRDELDRSRAGDDFAAQVDPVAYLVDHGWTYSHADGDGNHYLTRPGKDVSAGISATVFAESGLTYNHSPNSPGLPVGESVSPFGLVAYLEHDGDFSSARKALTAEGYGEAPLDNDALIAWIDDANKQPAPTEAALPERAERPTAPLDILRARGLAGDRILDVPPKAALVADLMDQGDMAVMYGAPGSGKSFISIDIAASVATGLPWQGHAVAQGKVLYVIAEGAHGVPGRWRAWKEHNGVTEDIPDVFWQPGRISLRDREWSKALGMRARELGCTLVIIDTLARTFDGGNENSSEDMGAYIAGTDDVREISGACVLVVHHGAKDTAAGSRGHSSLLGAVDAELLVKKVNKRQMTIESTKQKDREEGTPIALRLVPAAQSVAVSLDSGSRGSQVPAQFIEVLEALDEVATLDGVTTKVWVDNATDRLDVSESTIRRAIRELERRTAVRNNGTSNSPRWIPSRRAINNPEMLLTDKYLDDLGVSRGGVMTGSVTPLEIGDDGDE